MNLIPIPHWTENQISDFFDATIKEALSHGLTSIHDADSKLDHLAFFKKSVQPPSPHTLLSYLSRMAERGKLPVSYLLSPFAFALIVNTRTASTPWETFLPTYTGATRFHA
jgi:hypothetical protein